VRAHTNKFWFDPIQWAGVIYKYAKFIWFIIVTQDKKGRKINLSDEPEAVITAVLLPETPPSLLIRGWKLFANSKKFLIEMIIHFHANETKGSL